MTIERLDVYLYSIARAPPAHNNHLRINFQPQQSDLFGIYRMYSVCISLSCSPEGAVQLFWSCDAGRSHRSSHSITHRASQSSVLRTTKIPQPGNEGTSQRCAFASFPLILRAGSSLQPSLFGASTFSSLRAKKSPCGLQLVAVFIDKKA